jgi:hypothetical protein
MITDFDREVKKIVFDIARTLAGKDTKHVTVALWVMLADVYAAIIKDNYKDKVLNLFKESAVNTLKALHTNQPLLGEEIER